MIKTDTKQMLADIKEIGFYFFMIIVLFLLSLYSCVYKKLYIKYAFRFIEKFLKVEKLKQEKCNIVECWVDNIERVGFTSLYFDSREN